MTAPIPVDQTVSQVVGSVNSALKVAFPGLAITPEMENSLSAQVKQLVLQALDAADSTLRAQIVANGATAIGGSVGVAVGTALAGAITLPLGGLGAIVGADLGGMLGSAAGHLIGVAIQNELDVLVVNEKNQVT